MSVKRSPRKSPRRNRNRTAHDPFLGRVKVRLNWLGALVSDTLCVLLQAGPMHGKTQPVPIRKVQPRSQAGGKHV